MKTKIDFELLEKALCSKAWAHFVVKIIEAASQCIHVLRQCNKYWERYIAD